MQTSERLTAEDERALETLENLESINHKKTFVMHDKKN